MSHNRKILVEALERRVLLDAVPLGGRFRVDTTPLDLDAVTAVASDDAGNFVVVWDARPNEPAPPNWDVFARRYDAAGAPLGPQFLVAGGEFHQYGPSVAMDADGDFVVTWYDNSRGILGRRFTAAGGASEPFPLATSPHYGVGRPRVAMNAAGEFVVAWDATFRGATEFDPLEHFAYARRFGPAGAAAGNDFRVSTRRAYYTTRPVVALDDDGDFAVAWEADGPDVLSRRFDRAGRPKEDPALAYRGAEPFSPTAPEIAMDADGDFVVAWSDFPSAVRWRRYDDGAGAWGDVTEVVRKTAPAQSGQFHPALDMTADGDFVVAWRVYDDGPAKERSVRAQAYSAAGAKRGAEIIADYGEADSDRNYPGVALDERGRAAFTWMWRDAVWARRLGDVTPVAPPRVTGAFVAGTRWGQWFPYALWTRGLGDRAAGYAVPPGPAQRDELPWTNLDRVSLRFSRDVAVEPGALRVRGVAGPEYAPAGEGNAPSLHYDPATCTATWTLARPIPADRLSVELSADGVTAAGVTPAVRLDGEWSDASDAYPSGDGAAGGDFRLSLSVLPGDTNRDGRVGAADVLAVRSKQGRRPDDPAAAPNTAYHDLDGSNAVTSTDALLARRHSGRTLPPPPVTTSVPPRTRTAPRPRHLLTPSDEGAFA